MSSQTRNRVALTLMELVVVLSVLALLAALTVPKLVDITQRSRSGTQAFSLADINRQIEIFYGLNQKYPEGWDTLTTDGGSLYTKLSTELTSLLSTTTLSDDQVSSLKNAGIGHLFLQDATATDPSSSGTDRRHLGTGSGHDGTANINAVVVIDKSSGGKGLNLLVTDFGLNPNKAASDTTMPRISANTYVVFGLGPKSSMVQSQIQEAPILEHNMSATAYSRALAVFEVPNTGTTAARLVGVLGPDGRSKKVSLADYESQTGPTNH